MKFDSAAFDKYRKDYHSKYGVWGCASGDYCVACDASLTGICQKHQQEIDEKERRAKLAPAVREFQDYLLGFSGEE